MYESRCKPEHHDKSWQRTMFLIKQHRQLNNLIRMQMNEIRHNFFRKNICIHALWKKFNLRSYNIIESWSSEVIWVINIIFIELYCYLWVRLSLTKFWSNSVDEMLTTFLLFLPRLFDLLINSTIHSHVCIFGNLLPESHGFVAMPVTILNNFVSFRLGYMYVSTYIVDT